MENRMIGVAISTHRRPHILARALTHWAQHMPDILIVTHDINGDGVATTKNRGITALMDAGCDHLFLADDDIWPIAPWAEPYVQDPEPHLMHCWGNKRLLHDDGHYTTWTWPRGVLLYTERHVINTVGGMRTDFNHQGGGEHVEWTRRIHNAGFTTHKYTDLTATRRGVWHCEDYKRTTASSIPPLERQHCAQHRRDLYEKFRYTTDYVEYK